MATETLAEALEREHQEVDAGIATFVSTLSLGQRQPEPLIRAMRALRRHIYLEEQFLFPGLRTGPFATQILVMLREHAKLWATLDHLDAELDSGASDGLLAKRCHELTVQLQHHNSKEERTVYPQAATLPADTAAQLDAFFDTGQLPQGWVCAKAR